MQNLAQERRGGRLLPLPPAVVSPAFAAEVIVVTGLAPPVVQGPRKVDFGQGALSVSGCRHPQRFPHGELGGAWISIAARTTGSVWTRVVLRCQGLREAQPFPRDGWYRFRDLPEDEACELRVRGGGMPRTTVPVVTPTD